MRNSVRTVTTALPSMFVRGEKIVVTGTYGRDLPKWVGWRCFQDGDRMLVRWFCSAVLGWEMNNDGVYRVKSVSGAVTVVRES